MASRGLIAVTRVEGFLYDAALGIFGSQGLSTVEPPAAHPVCQSLVVPGPLLSDSDLGDGTRVEDPARHEQGRSRAGCRHTPDCRAGATHTGAPAASASLLEERAGEEAREQSRTQLG